MSFGGHVNDMVNRIKQHNALKNTRGKKFKGGNDYSRTKNIKTAYNIPKLLKEVLLQKQYKKKRNKYYIGFLE